MPKIIKLYGASNLSASEIENLAIETTLKENPALFLDRKKIADLYTKTADLDLLHVINCLDNNIDCYIYYAYHSSSGYKTEISISEQNEFIVNVISPTGITMSAFFHEVIIFKIGDE